MYESAVFYEDRGTGGRRYIADICTDIELLKALYGAHGQASVGRLQYHIARTQAIWDGQHTPCGGRKLADRGLIFRLL